MYLRHPWRIDLLGGLLYPAFMVSFFHRSLARIDKAYASGVSGGNGWYRLSGGTKLQYMFNERPELGYRLVLENNTDGESQQTSAEQMVRENREADVEAAWVRDLGHMAGQKNSYRQ
jgi:mannosyl-inositol-phosphoceramide inositolphosphotransferase